MSAEQVLTASKITQGPAAEYGKHRIRVNSVCLLIGATALLDVLWSA